MACLLRSLPSPSCSQSKRVECTHVGLVTRTSLTAVRPILQSLCLTFVAFLLSTSLPAQQPKVLAPHRPIAPKIEKPIKWLTPATPRSMVGGLWITDANFKSAIYLRNIVETDSVTVTPTLHLSNGAKYVLPNVTVDPAGIRIISINDELQKKGISSFATLSGYVEIEYRWPWDPFCATIRNIDTAHSLIFTYSLRPTLPLPLHILNFTPPVPTNTLEGMWWKQEQNVTGFVTVANLSTQPAEATIEVTDRESRPIRQHKVIVSPNGMKFVRLPELLTIGSVQGGVRVTSNETMDKLVVNGGLEDPAIGYSATLPFASEPVKQSDPEQLTIAELGLMVGAADAMMLFPAGTTFTPYSLVRNVSDGPVSATPTLWWMEAGKPHSVRLPAINLAPYETQSVDVPSMLMHLGPKNFNGSFNIVFETQARRGAVLMASGSVDQTGTYVFEVVPRGVTEGASKSLQQWSTGNGDDTMVTLWNPADEAQDFKFTLFFDGGHYALPLHVGPRETRGFNVSEIIQNQVPDEEGNLLPASVRQGTAKLAGSQAENEHILVAIDSGIYNVRKATCTNNCQTCNGYSAAVVVDDPYVVPVSANHQLNFNGTWGTGGQYNLNSQSNWSTNNASAATVGTGLVHGVSPGSATMSAFTSTQPIQAGYVCTGPQGCPTSNFQGSSGGTVTPDHLLVISDVTSVACTSNNTVKRQIKYWAVDVNGSQVGTEQTKEQFASKGPNSCNTSIGTSEACSTDAGGQLIDQIFVGCNSVGGSCGTTYKTQQWLYCPPVGIPVVFATPGDLYIHNDSILVGGYSQFPIGTKIGPNGVMP
jgi:hypothetical protein